MLVDGQVAFSHAVKAGLGVRCGFGASLVMDGSRHYLGFHIPVFLAFTKTAASVSLKSLTHVQQTDVDRLTPRAVTPKH